MDSDQGPGRRRTHSVGDLPRRRQPKGGIDSVTNAQMEPKKTKKPCQEIKTTLLWEEMPKTHFLNDAFLVHFCVKFLNPRRCEKYFFFSWCLLPLQRMGQFIHFKRRWLQFTNVTCGYAKPIHPTVSFFLLLLLLLLLLVLLVLLPPYQKKTVCWATKAASCCKSVQKCLQNRSFLSGIFEKPVVF